MKNSLLVLLLVGLVLMPVTAAGVGAGAIVMQFNTSARAAGMGEAGVAVPWGGDINHWANPALLAFRTGLQYRSFESQLAVGLADDIWLTDKEMTLGAYGVTFLLAKGPLEGTYLDMGNQMATDENGQIVGPFESYETSESWGLGVDGVVAAERLFNLSPGSISRHVTLAAGGVWHHYEEMLAPDFCCPMAFPGTLRATPRASVIFCA